MKRFASVCCGLALLMVFCFPALSNQANASANINVATLPTLLGYGAVDSLPVLVSLPQLISQNDPFLDESVVKTYPVKSNAKCNCCADCNCTSCGSVNRAAAKVVWQCGPNGCKPVRVPAQAVIDGVDFDRRMCSPPQSYGGDEGNCGPDGCGSARGNGRFQPVRRLLSRFRR